MSSVPLFHKPWLPAAAGAILLLLALLLYGITLDNGLTPEELHGGDLITHQYAQVQARPSNAPGYPLYTMGGWLWFHAIRPVAQAVTDAAPNPIPILSSYSTFWALIALWLLYAVIRFVTSSRYSPASRWERAGNWPLAWLVASFYAVTYFFWYYATTTEQYTSAIAQTLAILYLYLLWGESDREAGPSGYGLRSRPGRLLVGLGFVCGLSLAHMLTVALIVPPIVLAILWQRPVVLRRPGLMAAVIAAAAAPLLAYLYVYLRGAAHPEWWGSIPFETARDWFWFFVSTSQGRDELAWGFEPGARFFANGFPELIWGELGLLLLICGVAGLWLLRGADRVALYGTLALYLVFSWAYRYGNWYQVILPAYPLLLMGAALLFDRVQALPVASRYRWLRAIPALLLAVLIAWRFAASLPRADSRSRPEDTGLDRAALLLEAAPDQVALFASVDDALALDYLISIWGLHPAAALVSTDKANDALDAGRQLLTTWEMAPTLFTEGRLSSSIGLNAATPDWATASESEPPAPAVETDEQLAAGLVLQGFSAQPAPTGAPVTAGPPAMDVLLYWQLADGRWPDDLRISVRALRGGDYVRLPGGALSQQDAAAPLRGLIALARPDGPVVDAYRLPLTDPIPAGATGFEVLLYTDAGPAASARFTLPQ